MRKRTGNRLPTIGLCVLTLAMVAGCAPHFRAVPQLQEKLPSIKTVAIMPPNIKVRQISVGGDTQLMDDLTATVTQHVAKAIEKRLKDQADWVFKPFPSPSAVPNASDDPSAAGLQDDVEDTQALFEAVNVSVLLHTYPPTSRNASVQLFGEKLKNFDYSLGPDVERLAKFANADALLFISGVDHSSTGGRRALMALGIFLAATASVAVQQASFVAAAPSSPTPSLGAMVGPAVAGEATKTAVMESALHTTGSGWGTTALSVALVDGRTGAILWYNVVGFRAWSSLADSRSAADLVEEVLTDFPISGKPSQKD